MRLTIKDISFHYSSHPVLENVSFELNSGDILALLGINGAGKSTLLKCIDRILKPSMGTVFIDDIDLYTLKNGLFAQRIGYMPQKNGTPNITAYDMIMLGRKPYFSWEPSQNDHDIVGKYIKTMELSTLAFRYVDSLSGGEAQKVIIARAFAQEPDFILLDEPTNSLDLKNQIEVMSLVRHIAKDHGQTVIVTMHDINLALRFCDKFILLHQGFIHSAGADDIINEKNIRTVYGVDSAVKKINGIKIMIPREKKYTIKKIRKK